MNNNVRASGFMMLSMMGYTVNDMLIKTLAGSLSTSQIIAIRGAILTVLIVAVIIQQGLLPRIKEALSPLVGVRALMELGATLTFLIALMKLPLASTTAILQALPLAVTIGAALFFGEKVGWRRWLAIGVGFSGVLLIIRPGLDSFEPLSLLVLLAVVFAAGRDLVTRGLPVRIPSILVSGVSALLISLAGASIASASSSWQAMTAHQWGILSLAAMFLFVGYQFIVLAMRTGEIAYVVPFRYTSLLWAILLGYLVFDDIPDGITLAGSGIVVAMGLFTLYREVSLASRRAAANGTTQPVSAPEKALL